MLSKEERHALAARIRLGEYHAIMHEWRAGPRVTCVIVEALGAPVGTWFCAHRDGIQWEDGTISSSNLSFSGLVIEWLEKD